MCPKILLLKIAKYSEEVDIIHKKPIATFVLKPTMRAQLFESHNPGHPPKPVEYALLF